MRQVIAAANDKGGAGKTTSTLALTAAMLEPEPGVLLVDLEPETSVTRAMGGLAGDRGRSIVDVRLGEGTAGEVIRETSLTSLDLVPANQELITRERFLGVQEGHECLLRQALETVPSYDVVLLDCPPSLGPVIHCALAASMVIIPSQSEYHFAYALGDMPKLIRGVRLRANCQLRYRILLAMLDRRNRVYRDLEEQIRAPFGQAVFRAVIETDARLRDSPVAGLPITISALQAAAPKDNASLLRN
jgi:chromosome partitioning protein